MTIGDLQWYIDGSDDEILNAVDELIERGDVMTLKDKKTGEIKLVKASYDGLKKAYPAEYYRWFPTWITMDRKF